MVKILKGIDVADAICAAAADEASKLGESGVCPMLAILRVGEQKDQISYEKSAARRCGIAGVDVRNIVLPEDTSEAAVISNIKDLNDDKRIHGILILRPLPGHISDAVVRAALLPKKDVDGITDTSLAGVFTGLGTGFSPCTAKACMEILKHYNISCAGQRAVVIGRSLVVGRPAAMMLMAQNATVTICHTKTTGIPFITRQANIVIAAAGQPEALTEEFFTPGQTVIDVGINWSAEKGKLCGDVKFDEVKSVVGAITPVPGGVGTVTSAVLASHVVQAAIRQVSRI